MFRKALGGIYTLAFVSFGLQITGLIGARGILPLSLHLSRISDSYGPARYWDFPTVFWFNSSDLALKLVCAAGVLLSILVVAGYFERAALIGCWSLYLSLLTAGQDLMAFHWKLML